MSQHALGHPYMWAVAAVAFAIPFGALQESLLFGLTLPRIAIPLLFVLLLLFRARVRCSELCLMVALFGLLSSPSLVVGDGSFPPVFLNFVGYALLAVVVLNVVDTTEKLHVVVTAYAWGLTVVTAFAFVSLLTSFDIGNWLGRRLTYEIFGIKRLFGTEANPNGFALYYTCGLPIALYLWSRARSTVGRVAWPVLFVAFLVALSLTLARGALIGGVAGAIVYYAYRTTDRRKRFAIIAASAVLVVVLAWAATFSETIVAFVSLEEGVSNVLDDKSVSTQIRLAVFRALVQIYLDHPVFGIGYGNLPRLVAESTGQTLGAHNIFFGIAIELGFATLAIFCGIVAFVLLKARRYALTAHAGYDRGLAAVLLAMFVGQLLNGLVHESYINFMLWLNIALIGALPEVRQQPSFGPVRLLQTG
jgi:hypothetical protein